MASCSRCGAETELYDTGVPVCLACADREAKHPAMTGVADRDDEAAAAKKPVAKIPPDTGSFKTGA